MEEIKRRGRPLKQNVENTTLKAIYDVVNGMDKKIQQMDNRIIRIETPKNEEFKLGAQKEDIDRAGRTKGMVNEEVVKIVDEVLGEDFGVEIENPKEATGILFTIIVPPRLSLIPKSSRPKKDDNGEYIKDRMGVVQEEEYQPEDRRSKIISSTMDYEAMKTFCVKVRENIVNTYQKKNKPLPQFKGQ